MSARYHEDGQVKKVKTEGSMAKNTRQDFKRSSEAESAPEKARIEYAIQQIAQVSLSSLRFDDVLDNLTKHIVGAGIFRSLAVSVPDYESNIIKTHRATVRRSDGSWIDSEAGDLGVTTDLDSKDVLAETVRKGEIQIAVEWDERFDARNARERYENNVAYFIPVKKGQKVVAVLATGSTVDQRQEMLAKIEMLRPLLAHVAVALENARLYREAQEEIDRRLQAEVALRDREQTIRALVETSRDWIWSMNLDGRFTYSNPAVESILGYCPENVVGKPSYKFMHEADRGVFKKRVIEGIYKKCGWQDLSVRWRHVLGGVRHLESSATPMIDTNGKLTGFRGVDRDITERINTQKMLQEKVRIEQAIQRIAQISLSTLDFDDVLDNLTKRIVGAGIFGSLTISLPNFESKTVETVRGYTGESWIDSKSKNLGIKRSLDSRDILAETVRSGRMQVAEEGDDRFDFGQPSKYYPGQVNYFIPGKKGNEVVVVLATSSLLDEKGETLAKIEQLQPLLNHVVLALENARLYREALDEIAQRQMIGAKSMRLMAAIEQAAETIIITDAKGTMTYVNPAFERITGYSNEEAIGRSLLVIQSAEHDDAFFEDIWRVISGGDIWRGQLVNKRKDGSLFTAEVSISPVRDESGKTTSYVTVMHDITHEIALENQLRLTQKMEAIGKLASGVAHDFNNQLYVIQGYGEMVLEDVPPGTNVSRYMKAILGTVSRAANLVKQLMAFGRQRQLPVSILNLNVIIADLLALLNRVIGDHIALEFKPAKKNQSIEGDRGQIEQILMNLCVNARDAMPEGGNITIGTETFHVDENDCDRPAWAETGHYVLLSVRDTGRGMDQNIVERVFEPFFTTKGEDEGSGLGLSIVYGIVKRHRGTIFVNSNVGEGTVFEIYLPQSESPISEANVTINKESSPGTETILLAEDNDSARFLTAHALEKAGYSVLTAADGEVALEILSARGDEIDLALLDVTMPKLGGRAVYEYLLHHWPGISVLFASAYSENVNHTQFIIDNDLHLIQKPFKRGELLRKLRELLGDQSATA